MIVSESEDDDFKFYRLRENVFFMLKIVKKTTKSAAVEYKKGDVLS